MNTTEKLAFDKIERDFAKAKKMLADQDRNLTLLRAELFKYESSWVVRLVAKIMSPTKTNLC